MARREQTTAYRAAWSRFDRQARRRIMRAVNRGRTLDDPREAEMAVSAAMAQQRFWKKAWVVGPIIAAVLQWQAGWEVLAFNVVMAALVFGLMAFFFHSRARKAELANREVSAFAKRKVRKAPGHRPSREERRPSTPRGDDRPGERPSPHTSRKKLKRRRRR